MLLTTTAFLACLVVSGPWYLGPVAVVGLALGLGRTNSLVPPRVALHVSRDSVGAGLVTALLLSPIFITSFYMARGSSFPPVFYNIDTAYVLEKVHAFVAADTYPPESLSNVGIRRTYHYGTQAMAALISRTSGLLPHHSLFLIVIPLLTAGVAAAAVAAARLIAPALPRSITVPLLLISIPSPSNPFWDKLARQIWTGVTTGDISSAHVIGEYGLWGILSNESMNVGADFMILASLAAIAGAASWGWRLAAFLVGVSILVKTPVGVALVAGFALVELRRAVLARSLDPSPQALMAASVFIVTAVLFFVVGFESNFQVELSPFFHLRQMVDRGDIPGLMADVLWWLLPVLIVLSARATDAERRSAPILLLAIAPLIVVNATRMDNTRAGGGGTGDDWFQILHAVPFLLHAFALSLAGRRWAQLGSGRRKAFVLAAALTAWPVAAVAGHYSLLLLRDPQSGNDFVDNHALAEALASVPTSGTVVVTNDLRYPAGNFTRDYRQMQIPALYGHQAFAVNYAHEAVEERRPLQELLQQPEWSDAILDAARTYRWTHFLVRKDFAHPEPVPLRIVFENDVYVVFQLP